MNMRSFLRNSILCGSFSVMSLALGCGGGVAGPKVAPVKGLVTLDGKPLSQALVEFVPTSGRPSVAMTDANGNYELQYTQQTKGAMVGSQYKVKITSGREASTAEGVEVQGAVKEKVPEKYNAATTLTAEVKPGENQLDFKLDAK